MLVVMMMWFLDDPFDGQCVWRKYDIYAAMVMSAVIECCVVLNSVNSVIGIHDSSSGMEPWYKMPIVRQTEKKATSLYLLEKQYNFQV